ncbi:DUF1127 domain-containing protein [Sedimentitalea sp.]|uniref:DUF1127 domain-containing protein n=1 Tax=Sedimentitalea sp. TaxID=2048915 RepID=UPI003299E506
MTLMNQSQLMRGRPTSQEKMANLIHWWRERRRLKRDLRKLAEMPDYLLRDVGLEHLVELKPDTPSDHRLR